MQFLSPTPADGIPAVDAPSELLLRALFGHNKQVTPTAPANQVQQFFRADPRLPGVIVLDREGWRGMIARSSFFQQMSKPMAQEVYGNRPVSLLLEHIQLEPLVLDGACTVRDAVDACLARPPERHYEPVVVRETAMEYRVIDFNELIIAQSGLLRSALQQGALQRELLAEKNRSILDSIHYAERIQKSMLRSQERIADTGVNPRCLFRPRDIVSGDFFWFAQREGKVLLAAVDCTGHGVPGAFMSLIGHSLLDEIVVGRGIVEPGEILAQLHHEVRASLHQSNAADSPRDGMDVCLCVIDVAAAELKFSGAKRPLYHTDSSGEIQVCRGDRFSIGGIQREETRQFATVTLPLIPGAALYLTTDGLADQPSPSQQKYGSSRLKSLLRRIGSLPLDDKVAALAASLDEHQAGQEQRDDITIIVVEWNPPVRD